MLLGNHKLEVSNPLDISLNLQGDKTKICVWDWSSSCWQGLRGLVALSRMIFCYYGELTTDTACFYMVFVSLVPHMS